LSKPVPLVLKASLNMAQATHLLCDVRNKVGESPVWSVQEQALYWVDIEGQQIHRVNWLSRAHQSWNVPERVGCIALSNRGTVIAAMETGVFELNLQNASDISIHRIAGIQHPEPNMRFNDGRCDAAGRFWIGTMCRDMSLASTAGGIYCVDTSGLRGPVLSGFITPNGMAFNRESTVAYLSDSHPSSQKIWTYPFDVANGTWGSRTDWVNMVAMPGRPDGAALDTEGCYWICANDAGMVHRFSPEGALLSSISLPVSKLFVTSIKPGAPVAGYDHALEGAVFVVDPDAQGLPEPLFSQFPVSPLP
jgi:sugar lactone lactonase YvrE